MTPKKSQIISLESLLFQLGTITTGGASLTTGSGLGLSTTAGNLIVQTLTTAPLIAYNMQTQTDAQCGMVFLNL